ncbi:MAG: hypothetical protein NZ923_10405 [Candidatus Kryptonium sp.]|nr:hypothetical protein [Candidatus Kryptonium sp.]
MSRFADDFKLCLLLRHFSFLKNSDMQGIDLSILRFSTVGHVILQRIGEMWVLSF